MWTMNFQMSKLVLEKAEEPEIKLPTSAGWSKKQESSRKTSISALLTVPKHLTLWITTNGGKLWKRWEYQTTWPASWEIGMQVRNQQLELDMNEWLNWTELLDWVNSGCNWKMLILPVASCNLNWFNHFWMTLQFKDTD